MDIGVSGTAKMSFVKIQQEPSIELFMIPPMLPPRDQLEDPVPLSGASQLVGLLIMLKRVTFPRILATVFFVTLAGTSPSLAQRGGFRGGGGGGVHGGGAFHGNGSSGGFHQGGSLNTFHGGGVNRSYRGGFTGYYGSHYYHGGHNGYPYYGGYYGYPYYYRGYYGYPWYGGFSFGFGVGPFWGSSGYPYGYGYYPPPYPYYPYGPYGSPAAYPDDRNDSSDPPDHDRGSRDPHADNRNRCDYRYEDTCNTNDEQRPAPSLDVTPSGSAPGRNYVITNVAH
jgi:hypothetical protein